MGGGGGGKTGGWGECQCVVWGVCVCGEVEEERQVVGGVSVCGMEGVCTEKEVVIFVMCIRMLTHVILSHYSYNTQAHTHTHIHMHHIFTHYSHIP